MVNPPLWAVRQRLSSRSSVVLEINSLQPTGRQRQKQNALEAMWCWQPHSRNSEDFVSPEDPDHRSDIHEWKKVPAFFPAALQNDMEF